MITVVNSAPKLAGICIILSAAANLLAAQPPQRITSSIDEERTFKLLGNTKPMLVLAENKGQVSDAQVLPRITMHLQMSSQQSEDLQMLLRQQQAPGSAQFHKFLTPEEYAARFGANTEDIAKISAWLERSGFSQIEVARGRNFVTFTGNAGHVKSAFHTSIHRYVLDGETHYANSTDPLLPKALDGMVESIRGLNDFKPHPLNIRKQRPHFTSSISGDHFLAPNDFATMYDVQPLYSAGLDGTGVKIAVVGQSDIVMSDIEAFRTAAGLPQNNPTVVLTGKDPGIQSKSGDESESDLDLEWSGGIAKNASIIFVTSTDAYTSTSYAIDNDLAPVLSTSYGLCEAQTGQADSNTYATEYMKANAEGMTVIAAAGDAGAADCDTNYPASQGLAVDEPASIPYVTGIGGTTLTEGSVTTYWNSTNNSYAGSAASYIPEVVWNDSVSDNALDAGGGGASIYFSKPSWQTGTGVPSDGARDVPDLAFAASPGHDGYLICSGDGGDSSTPDCTNGFRDASTDLDVIGGTSCAAPSFAGIVALIVQRLGAQGNINPNLYSLAATATNVYHDITSGNNMIACKPGTPNCGSSGMFGYTAAAGYDQASGWGSVDAYQLLTQWLVGNTAAPSAGPLTFVPITPCRVVDTRNGAGAFSGTQTFSIPLSTCDIPSTVAAYALNVTVVPNGPLGYLSIWPTGQSQPLASTLNSDGRVKANSAIVPAGTGEGLNVYASDATQVVLDISGYFVANGTANDLQFFPLTPCRVADTRNSTPLVGGDGRAFTIAGTCGVPTTAQAYSLNFTVIPRPILQYLAAWPTGQAQPEASILNAPTGSVTANAAIIPAGTGGSITAFGSNNTDLVIDINGYFATPATGGLSLYTLTPCRVVDTRNPAGNAPFTGDLEVNVLTSGCGAPATAQAYVLNATVVPSGPLYFLALWPYGEGQPDVSTLNADSNAVTSNLAIVPTINGAISAYASNPTYLILDMSGYFAP